MGRIVKWLMIAIGSILTLLVIFVAALVVLVDPNDYRDEIQRAVAAQTGRELVIGGDLELTYFPWIGLRVADVRLADVPEFGKAPFFRADHIRLGVELLPLLRGKLVLDAITLEHPQIHLVRNTQGLGNWQTFAAPAQEPEAPTEQPPADSQPGTPPEERRAPPLLLTASLGGLRIRDGVVTWNDRQSGDHAVLSPLNTTVDEIRLGAPISIKADWQGRIKESVDIDGQLTGRVTADPRLEHVDGEDLELTLKVAGEEIPGGSQQLRVHAQAAADLAQATYRLTELRLDGAGVQITGEFAAQPAGDDLTASGVLEIPELNPRDVLHRLGLEAPDTRDPDVLKRASAKTQLRYHDGVLAIEPLTVQLDDSTLSGQAKLRDPSGPAVDFDLSVDRINADRYRPTAGKGGSQAAGTPAEAAAAGAGQLPLETLRTLDLNGHMHIATLKMNGATVSDADVTIRARDGRLRAHPLTANLYGGTYRGDMRLDATGKAPRIELDERLSGVQAGPLLTDTASFQKLLGTADLSLRASTQGDSPEDWLQALNGLAGFTFRNGAVKGINIAQTLREALARFKGEPPPPTEAPLQTDFSELGGTLHLDGGSVRNSDFSAKTPLLRVQGGGNANLLEQTVDYRLTAKIVGSLKGQGGEDLEALRGVPIPLHFTGKLSQPNLSVDLASLFEKRLELKRQELEEKGRKKLEEKLNEGLQRLFNR